MNKTEKGSAHIIALAAVLLLVIGFASWRVIDSRKPTTNKEETAVKTGTDVVTTKIETVKADGSADALMQALDNEVATEASNEDQSSKSEQASANSVSASDVNAVGDIQNEINL